MNLRLRGPLRYHMVHENHAGCAIYATCVLEDARVGRVLSHSDKRPHTAMSVEHSSLARQQRHHLTLECRHFAPYGFSLRDMCEK